jgi:hypothetical protein
MPITPGTGFRSPDRRWPACPHQGFVWYGLPGRHRRRGRLFAFLAGERSGPEALRKGWNRPLSDLMLPQGVFPPFLSLLKNAKARLISGLSSIAGQDSNLRPSGYEIDPLARLDYVELGFKRISRD